MLGTHLLYKKLCIRNFLVPIQNGKSIKHFPNDISALSKNARLWSSRRQPRVHGRTYASTYE